MAYRCEQAIFGGARDAIRCKVSGTVCAHQKMCMMEGRTVLTDKAMSCPARDGKMPEEPKKKATTVERVEKIPDVDAAVKEPKAKPAAKAADAPAKKRGRKPAAEKTAAEKKTSKTTGRKKG